MRASLLMTVLCTIAVAACDGSGDGTSTGGTQTIKLDANADGTLGYCDASGTCQSLPNPDNCATLTVTVDTASGQACQVCTAADGTQGAKNCKTPSVACDVITIPNPNCVVCAYVNGTVIFSSCQPTPPICYTANADGTTTSSGGGTATPGTVTNGANVPASNATPPTDAAGVAIAPAIGCTICTDATGNRVSQDCPPVCNIACPAIACGPGSQMVTTPGECCGHCEPIKTNCDGIACPDSIPVCPDGQQLTKDPTQCCGWYCQPVACNIATPVDANAGSGSGSAGSAIGFACPDHIVDCAQGYVWSTEPPHCCGACVAATCKSADDCGPNQTCIQPPCACIPDGSGGCTTPADCVGHCSAPLAD